MVMEGSGNSPLYLGPPQVPLQSCEPHCSCTDMSDSIMGKHTREKTVQFHNSETFIKIVEFGLFPTEIDRKGIFCSAEAYLSFEPGGNV